GCRKRGRGGFSEQSASIAEELNRADRGANGASQYELQVYGSERLERSAVGGQDERDNRLRDQLSELGGWQGLVEEAHVIHLALKVATSTKGILSEVRCAVELLWDMRENVVALNSTLFEDI